MPLPAFWHFIYQPSTTFASFPFHLKLWDNQEDDKLPIPISHFGFNIKLPCEDSDGIRSLILFLFFWSCWMLVDVWQRGSSVCLLISRLNLRPKSMGAAKVLDESCTKVTTIKTATSPSSLLCKRCFNQKGEIKLWEYWFRLLNETYWPALVSYVVFMPW